MANVAPQIPPILNYDLEIRDTFPDSIQLNSATDSLKPQSWELYVERIAPGLARQTGESVEEARHQLMTLFQPLPDQIMDTDAMLRAMDWDDETDEVYSTRPPVTQSGVVSKHDTLPSPDRDQLIANENGIPIYVDSDVMKNPAS